MPFAGTRSYKTSFCCNPKILWIRVERFSNQLFGYIGAVAVGGINEIDAQTGKGLQYPNGFISIFRWSPNSLTRDAHGTIAHSIYNKLVAQFICFVCSGDHIGVNNLLQIPDLKK